MKKKYYVVMSSHGCYGAEGTVKRLPTPGCIKQTNKQEMEKFLSNCKKESEDGLKTLFWLDFEWVK